MNDLDLSGNDKVIARKLDEIKGEVDNLINLSSGVVLLARPANPLMLIRVMTAHPRPQPPTHFDQMMGREIENPDHPDYVKRVEQWQMEYNNSMLNALIGLGTQLHSKPKKLEGPDGNKWLSDYKSYGLPILPDSESWRYIAWVMSVAVKDDNDTKIIGDKVRQLSGVKEAEVESATTFSERN